MDYRVVFSEEALSDLAGIVEYVALDEDAAASRFGDPLLDHIDLLGRFPRMGEHCPRGEELAGSLTAFTLL